MCEKQTDEKLDEGITPHIKSSSTPHSEFIQDNKTVDLKEGRYEAVPSSFMEITPDDDISSPDQTTDSGNLSVASSAKRPTKRKWPINTLEELLNLPMDDGLSSIEGLKKDDLSKFTTKLLCDLQGIKALGTDGATVMVGRKEGLTGHFLRGNAHLVQTHCSAHRVALCSEQAAEGIPGCTRGMYKSDDKPADWPIGTFYGNVNNRIPGLKRKPNIGEIRGMCKELYTRRKNNGDERENVSIEEEPPRKKLCPDYDDPGEKKEKQRMVLLDFCREKNVQHVDDIPKLGKDDLCKLTTDLLYFSFICNGKDFHKRGKYETPPPDWPDGKFWGDPNNYIPNSQPRRNPSKTQIHGMCCELFHRCQLPLHEQQEGPNQVFLALDTCVLEEVEIMTTQEPEMPIQLSIPTLDTSVPDNMDLTTSTKELEVQSQQSFPTIDTSVLDKMDQNMGIQESQDMVLDSENFGTSEDTSVMENPMSFTAMLEANDVDFKTYLEETELPALDLDILSIIDNNDD